jgi:hypothetical protein
VSGPSQRKHFYRATDPLQLPRTKRPGFNPRLVTNRLAHLGGGTQATSFGQGAEPSREVHAITRHFVADTHDVAHVDADVKIEIGFFFNRIEDHQGATHGVEGARKHHEAFVAAHLDLLAAMALDQRLHERPVSLTHAKTAGLVFGHQGRVPDDIREEDGR